VTLLVGLAGVLGLSQLLRKKNGGVAGHVPERREPSTVSSTGGPFHAAARFAAAVLLLVAVVGSTAAVWQAGRVIAGVEPDAPISDIPLRVGDWVGEDEPTDAGLRPYLACDTAVHREYRDPAGQRLHCWVLYWSSVAAVKDYIHHPDVCWPMQGWAPAGQDRKAVRLADGTPLEMTVRWFERDGRRQVIAYWAQDGRRVWTAEEEERAHTSWPTQRWVLDRLLSQQSLERTPRLVVLVGADVWGGGYADRAVDVFATELAAELYRVCPWARPAAGE